MGPEINSLIGGFPFMPGPLEGSFTVIWRHILATGFCIWSWKTYGKNKETDKCIVYWVIHNVYLCCFFLGRAIGSDRLLATTLVYIRSIWQWRSRRSRSSNRESKACGWKIGLYSQRLLSPTLWRARATRSNKNCLNFVRVNLEIGEKLVLSGRIASLHPRDISYAGRRINAMVSLPT